MGAKYSFVRSDHKKSKTLFNTSQETFVDMPGHPLQVSIGNRQRNSMYSSILSGQLIGLKKRVGFGFWQFPLQIYYFQPVLSNQISLAQYPFSYMGRGWIGVGSPPCLPAGRRNLAKRIFGGGPLADRAKHSFIKGIGPPTSFLKRAAAIFLRRAHPDP